MFIFYQELVSPDNTRKMDVPIATICDRYLTILADLKFSVVKKLLRDNREHYIHVRVCKKE